MTKRLCSIALLVNACLHAAEFWASKPYTSWSEKEVAKLLTDSPWARNIDASRPALPDQPGGGVNKTIQMSSASDVGGAMWNRDVKIVVLWQSAMPVKQALMKAKYGAAAATSAEAQTVLQRPEQFYVIRLAALSLNAQVPTVGDAKEAMLGMTTLSSSGRAPLVAEDIQVVAQPLPPGAGTLGGTQDLYFFFSRTMPFVADKDVEFVTKFGPFVIKRKFHLKDMVVNGKLQI